MNGYSGERVLKREANYLVFKNGHSTKVNHQSLNKGMNPVDGYTRMK